MIATPQALTITWEPLPEDYCLPDDPVDNLTQSLLAEALTNAFRHHLDSTEPHLIATNYGICATLNDKIVVKAPDWVYVPHVAAPPETIERSYTPQVHGGTPLVVMEFISATEGGEYSIKPTYPPGKWYFYERVLQVPVYVIFNPVQSLLELYRLDENGRYQLQTPDAAERHWLPELGLALGSWQGEGFGRSGDWLRWWDESGNLLLWDSERAEQERERAEQERARAERLLAQLRAAGLDPEA
ncbi:Uma2 family endonuclease [Spirulina major]|uniref:Uma2 family endonuclease n=1 Tax=Spirulina major TaxID=270636 RepID=UPI0009322EEB|nr:Uma2 family endonuclease [Spirulina major]